MASRLIRNFDDIIAALRAYADTVPDGAWVLGYGYDHNKLEEGRHPNRHILDRASDRHPIAILHACDNMTVANSLALERSGILKGAERGTAHGVELAPDGSPQVCSWRGPFRHSSNLNKTST